MQKVRRTYHLLLNTYSSQVCSTFFAQHAQLVQCGTTPNSFKIVHLNVSKAQDVLVDIAFVIYVHYMCIVHYMNYCFYETKKMIYND